MHLALLLTLGLAFLSTLEAASVQDLPLDEDLDQLESLLLGQGDRVKRAAGDRGVT